MLNEVTIEKIIEKVSSGTQIKPRSGKKKRNTSQSESTQPPTEVQLPEASTQPEASAPQEFNYSPVFMIKAPLGISALAASPLRIAVTLDDIPCTTYLDTGAGVVVLGGGWLSKRSKNGMPEPTLQPTSLQLKGVKTIGIAVCKVKFFNEKTEKVANIHGVVCPIGKATSLSPG